MYPGLGLEHDPAEKVGCVRCAARTKHDDGNASGLTLFCHDLGSELL